MIMRIFTSTHTPPQHHSVYTHVFPSNDEVFNSASAFIDALTDRAITRGNLRSDTLRFAYGIRRRLSALGGNNLKEGDTLFILSPNSLLYPVVFLGALAAGVRVACSSAAQVPSEVAHQISITQPNHFIVHPSNIKCVVLALRSQGYDLNEIQRRVILLGKTEDLSENSIGKGWVTFSDIIDHQEPWDPVQFDGEKAHQVSFLAFPYFPYTCSIN